MGPSPIGSLAFSFTTDQRRRINSFIDGGKAIPFRLSLSLGFGLHGPLGRSIQTSDPLAHTILLYYGGGGVPL